MATYVQAERPLRVATPLGKDVLLLVGIDGQEAVSQPFNFQLDVLAENEWDIPFERLLGQKVTADLLLPNGKRRFFNGICLRVSQGHRDKYFTSYRLEIVPQFALLTRRAQTRIFQHESVPEILKKVLAGIDAGFEIQGTFQPRDYCVQYRETDLAFASRLMEEEGIYYFFKHTETGHRMVLANTPQTHPDLPEASTLIFEEVVGSQSKEDRIVGWRKSQELRAGKVTLWDHCFELPHLHLDADKAITETVLAGKVTHKQRVGGNDKLEIYDFPGAYAQRFDGIDKGGSEQPSEMKKIYEDNQRTAGIRMQQEAVRGLVIQGTGGCRQMVSGHKFTLTRHFNADGPYVLTTVEHHAKLTGDYRSGEEAEFSYENQFTCIPLAQPYRPQRTTVKPCVPGTQTAVVVGPPGEEIFTDKYGRVKVQFHWDRQGKNNADSACWVRVAQPWAGKRWGAFFWPRIGQEVIVDFLEGDPDQPIIVGSVYNADQMPPYLGNGLDPEHPNDNKLTGVKSSTTPGGQGFNEWRFDDTKGQEQVFIHAQRNMDVRVNANEMESVGGNRHLTVGGEKNGKKSGDQVEQVYQDKHLHVHRHHVELIEGNMELRVGPSDGGGNQDTVIRNIKKEWIGSDNNLHVVGNDIACREKQQQMIVGKEQIEQIGTSVHRTVKDNRNEQVGGDQYLKVGHDHMTQVVNNIYIKAGGALTLVAPAIEVRATETLCLRGPAGMIQIDGAGVKIDGTTVDVNCHTFQAPTVDYDWDKPLEPVQPAKVHQAQPNDPAPADDSKSGQKSAPA